MTSKDEHLMRYTVYAAFLGSSSELLEESVLNKLAAKPPQPPPPQT